MTFYRFYSLCLKSPRPLRHVTPAAESTGGEPDIELCFSQAHEPSPAWENLPWSVVREQAGLGWRLSLATAPAAETAALRLSTQRQHDETTVYFGRNAAQISVHWRFDGEDHERFWMELSGWLLGSVLGFAMALRGLPTLHGSVVAVNGQAIGLLGVSGAGKSTLAAAFVAAGHAMLADDHLVVAHDAGGYRALPGPPRLRLWPASLPVIEAEPATLPFSADTDGKHFVAPLYPHAAHRRTRPGCLRDAVPGGGAERTHEPTLQHGAAFPILHSDIPCQALASRPARSRALALSS
jgi:hypothetical protein